VQYAVTLRDWSICRLFLFQILLATCLLCVASATPPPSLLLLPLPQQDTTEPRIILQTSMKIQSFWDGKSTARRAGGPLRKSNPSDGMLLCCSHDVCTAACQILENPIPL
jgi:hypothetical protein